MVGRVGSVVLRTANAHIRGTECIESELIATHCTDCQPDRGGIGWGCADMKNIVLQRYEIDRSSSKTNAR